MNEYKNTSDKAVSIVYKEGMLRRIVTIGPGNTAFLPPHVAENHEILMPVGEKKPAIDELDEKPTPKVIIIKKKELQIKKSEVFEKPKVVIEKKEVATEKDVPTFEEPIVKDEE